MEAEAKGESKFWASSTLGTAAPVHSRLWILVGHFVLLFIRHVPPTVTKFREKGAVLDYFFRGALLGNLNYIFFST